MATVPDALVDLTSRLIIESDSIEGHLSKREVRFLALLAACPTTSGTILEIGSFKGRSTVILAKASSLASEETIFAVDPLTSPSVTDPDLHGALSAQDDFEANLAKSGVSHRVTFYHMTSQKLAQFWDNPIRLLWIDGDHTYSGVASDLDLFSPHLANGAIVALHDVLHAFDGPIRAFSKTLLESRHFGASGICGSIGWGQYFHDPTMAESHRKANAKLQSRVQRLIPILSSGHAPVGLAKIRFKLFRGLVPHGSLSPETWTNLVTFLPKGSK